jgi:hypothetical protein
MADDFCLDEDAGLAYITTRRENTIDRVPLAPGGRGTWQIVVGDRSTSSSPGPPAPHGDGALAPASRTQRQCCGARRDHRLGTGAAGVVVTGRSAWAPR